MDNDVFISPFITAARVLGLGNYAVSILEAKGLRLQEGEIGQVESRSLSWLKENVIKEMVSGWYNKFILTRFLQMAVIGEESITAITASVAEKGGESQNTAVTMQVLNNVWTLMNGKNQSDFLQVSKLLFGNHRISWGIAEAKFSASTTSATVAVRHKLSAQPQVVIATPQLGVLASANTFEYNEETFKVVAFVQNALTLTATIPWIAISF